MGFLNNRAMKRAEQFCQPAMDAGEIVLDFDIGNVTTNGLQVAVMATTQAVYVAPVPMQGRPMVFPYLLLEAAEDYNKMLILTSRGGSQLMVRFTGSRNLRSIVVQEVQKADTIRASCRDDAALRRALGPKKVALYDALAEPQFLERSDFGHDQWVDWYVQPGGRLVWQESPALQAAQPPLQMFLAMQVDKERKRIEEGLAADGQT